jgi:hypothetical protein
MSVDSNAMVSLMLAKVVTPPPTCTNRAYVFPWWDFYSLLFFPRLRLFQTPRFLPNCCYGKFMYIDWCNDFHWYVQSNKDWLCEIDSRVKTIIQTNHELTIRDYLEEQGNAKTDSICNHWVLKLPTWVDVSSENTIMVVKLYYLYFSSVAGFILCYG